MAIIDGRISALDEAGPLAGDEWVEIIQRVAAGEWFNRKLPVSSLKGLKGDDGANAFVVAQQNGFEGTESEWLESLRGLNAHELAVSLGFTGDLDAWLLSLIGKSAYQVAVEQGFTGSKGDWLATLVGPRGVKGDTGTKGDDAYTVAVAEGFVGTRQQWLASLKGEQGDIGPDGRSAYQLAQENGFTGSREEWLTSLRGPQGKTAYQVAVDNGYEGTVEDWLTSLRGAQGIAGTDGTDGDDGLSAYEIAVEQGFEGTVEEWLDSLRGAPGEGGGGGASVAAVMNITQDYLRPTTDHVGNYLRMRSTASESVVLIPPDSEVAWPLHAEIHIERVGRTVVIVGDLGVTVNCLEGDGDLGNYSNLIAGRFGTVTLKRVDANEWTLFGALSPGEPIRELWLDDQNEPMVTADQEVLYDVPPAIEFPTKYVQLVGAEAFMMEVVSPQ